VVLDTNVLLAAIAAHGLCQALVTLVFRDHLVILSEHILGEVAKHDQRTFKATKRQADAAVAVLRANGEVVEPVTVPPGTVRDKDDLPVLGTAVAGFLRTSSRINAHRRGSIGIGRPEAGVAVEPNLGFGSDRPRWQGPWMALSP
jgi:putative PIN family toxin of toxin-antitoxin system